MRQKVVAWFLLPVSLLLLSHASFHAVELCWSIEHDKSNGLPPLPLDLPGWINSSEILISVKLVIQAHVK